jgi:2-phosphosulfolactate phosphatase
VKQIKIHRLNFPRAGEARGITIVIDVIRAFTVAAYAFAGGASRLWLVRTTDEAFALRGREPGAMLAGEIGGRLIPGFDFNNSPALMAKASLAGRVLIQRTGAGTQGAVNAAHSHHLLICSLVNAKATAQYARTLATETGEPVTLLPTGKPDEAFPLTEDDFCADYLEALITCRDDALQVLADRTTQLRTAGRFSEWQQGNEGDFPAEDIDKVLDANRFSFAMAGTRKEWDGIVYVEVERMDLHL